MGNRSARAGAYATGGAQLVSLVPAHGLWVDANFKESQLAGMHDGMPVTIAARAAQTALAARRRTIGREGLLTKKA